MSKPQFIIQDENGVEYNRLKQPAAVFDKDSGTLYKIGEKEDMIAYYNVVVEKYRSSDLINANDIADNIVYMDLPKDQTEINLVFQITGYIKKLYEQHTEK